MFREINIQNFRGIKKLKIGNFGKLNLLVGKNNTCKTSVMEAFCVVSNPNNPGLIHQLNSMRGLLDIQLTTENSILDTNQDSFEALFYEGRYDPLPSISSIDHSGKELKLQIKPSFLNAVTTNSRQAHSLVSTRGKAELNGLEFFFSVSEPNHQIGEISKKSFRSRVVLSNKFRNGQVFEQQLVAQPDDSYKKEFDEKALESGDVKFIGSNSGFSDAPNQLLTRFDQIKLNKKKDELIELLRHLEGSIRDIDFINGAFRIELEKFSAFTRFEILGQGAKKFFSLACNILGDSRISKNSVILIDEVENGLHWESQNILWDWLFKIAKERNIQIFATTHSLDTVRSFTKAAQDNQEEDVRVFRLEKYDNDLIQTELNYEDLKIGSGEMGLDPR